VTTSRISSSDECLATRQAYEAASEDHLLAQPVWCTLTTREKQREAYMRHRVAAIAVLCALLLVIPLGASANFVDCPTVEGTAIYNYGDGFGTANLIYDGEQLFVPILQGTGTPEYVEMFWEFPDGTVTLHEDFDLTFKGAAVEFHSEVLVVDGGTGYLTWEGMSIPARGFAAIRQIEGRICVGSGD
jgi:hypothetical protein